MGQSKQIITGKCKIISMKCENESWNTPRILWCARSKQAILYTSRGPRLTGKRVQCYWIQWPTTCWRDEHYEGYESKHRKNLIFVPPHLLHTVQRNIHNWWLVDLPLIQTERNPICVEIATQVTFLNKITVKRENACNNSLTWSFVLLQIITILGKWIFSKTFGICKLQNAREHFKHKIKSKHFNQ